MSQQRPLPPGPATSEAAALRRTGASPLRPGDPGQVGPYVPLALLGSGGMGRVYLARPVDGRPGLVAVKVIRPEYADDPRFRRRFEREASVHARLRTPYTPGLCGTGFRDELLWMATEYLPGLDLAEAVRDGGALETGTVWRLTAELGRALVGLAAAEIVHRDLKPSNVLLSVRGAHVIDFGISRAVDASAITGTGNRVGTPAYMSPEHLRTGHSDTASDVFSLAGTLVYAATGRAPFGDGTGVDVMHRVAFEEPNPALLTRISAADPALGSLLSACLSKDPGSRPTPEDLVTAAEPHTGTAPGWPEPLGAAVRARQQAYDVLFRLPVERRARLGDPAGAPGDPARSVDAAEATDLPGAGRASEARGPLGAAALGPSGAEARVPSGAEARVPSAAEAHAPSGGATDNRSGGATNNPSSGGTDAPSAVVPSTPLRASAVRGWARRKPVLAGAAAVVVCVVAAGVFVLTRPDGPAKAYAPGSGAASSAGARPSDAPSASGAPDGPSAEGASGRKAGDAEGAAARPGVSESASGDAEDEETEEDAADVGPRSPSPSSPTGEADAPPVGPAPDPSTQDPGSATPPWISDCTHYSGNGRARRGDSGKRVLQVQCMLTERGYAVGDVDGDFGAATESAVRGFQGDKGLSADGIVGHDTWSALRGTE
ncbi:serine/threonine-protein kinase [Streptomyces griseus]|uniref:serine/threonine-protein kinase n=1 Tax=Streptomyces griseus TaxID=1911 RepID=UPI00056B5548|nr:serine/threonine-protein kinase [Streptomyces griseus]